MWQLAAKHAPSLPPERDSVGACQQLSRKGDRPLTLLLPFAREDHRGECVGQVSLSPSQWDSQRVPCGWKAGACQTRSTFASSVWKHLPESYAQLTVSGYSLLHPSCGPPHPRGEKSILFDVEEGHLLEDQPVERC